MTARQRVRLLAVQGSLAGAPALGVGGAMIVLVAPSAALLLLLGVAAVRIGARRPARR